jgi:hypothetical protein
MKNVKDNRKKKEGTQSPQGTGKSESRQILGLFVLTIP